eukprot:jgi/Galph1/692/GphlegSOOS_G5460.1
MALEIPITRDWKYHFSQLVPDDHWFEDSNTMYFGFIQCTCFHSHKLRYWKKDFPKVTLKKSSSQPVVTYRLFVRLQKLRYVMTTTDCNDPSFSRSREFDYVIVGGGAAGCVLASRLSASKKASVLLLEAGKEDDNFYLHVPMGFPFLIGSELDWKFSSETEERLLNRLIVLPRGKVLGGSHAISVMLYLRGAAQDYIEWEESGAQGWGPDDVLPYFIKSESRIGYSNSRYHGKDGPLQVSDLPSPNEMTHAFVVAAQAADIAPNYDFNDWSRSQEGVGFFQVTQMDGKRVSPATAYLHPVRGRRNLHVETQRFVEKILFSREPGDVPRAIGVSYINTYGKRERAIAKKEVIVSAGTYGTPKLLMLSGLGPPNLLSSLNIPVLVPLDGIGSNLQDHPAVMLSCESPNPKKDKLKSHLYYTERTGKDLRVVLQWFLSGKGPLTSTLCEAGAFLKTDAQYSQPDLQLRFIPLFSEPDPYFALDDYASKGTHLRNQSNRTSGFSIQSVCIRPKSRGNIRLRSTDPMDSLIIESGWYSCEEDLQTLLKGIQISQKIAQTSPLSSYFGQQCFPSPDLMKEKDLVRYILSTSHTANASVGTCRMGNDKDAVVDSQLKVIGVNHLRIVDASVMPTIPGGQTGAPTMMIAEKAADMILKELVSSSLEESMLSMAMRVK